MKIGKKYLYWFRKGVHLVVVKEKITRLPNVFKVSMVNASDSTYLVHSSDSTYLVHAKDLYSSKEKITKKIKACLKKDLNIIKQDYMHTKAITIAYYRQVLKSTAETNLD